jgi:hypothetical protein
VSTTSRPPASTILATCSTTSARATERELPRPNGMTQNVQRWSQPFCTGTKARVCPAMPAIRVGVAVRTAMMSSMAARACGRAGPAQVSARPFASLPTRRATSGIAA